MEKTYTVDHTVYDDSGDGTLTIYLVEQIAVAPGLIPLIGQMNTWPIKAPTDSEKTTFVKGAKVTLTLALATASGSSSSTTS